MKQAIIPFLMSVTLLLGGCTAEGELMRNPTKLKFQNITISAADGVQKFQTTNDLSPKVRPKMKYWYHWYHPHELHKTAGNFSGRLLDGDYGSYFSNGSLKGKGEFKKGLKTGEWMMWYENGQLKEVTEFKKGQKHGVYRSFEPNGNLMMEGIFKKGVYVGPKKSAWKQFVEFITFKKLRTPKEAE